MLLNDAQGAQVASHRGSFETCADSPSMVSRSISKFPKKYETTATKLAELIASDPNNARVQLLAGLTRLSPEA